MEDDIDIVSPQVDVKPSSKMFALPSYLLKLHYGSQIQTEFHKLQSGDSVKEDSYQRMVNELSTMGVLGTRPSLYLENKEKVYLNQMIDRFQSHTESAQDELDDAPIQTGNGHPSVHTDASGDVDSVMLDAAAAADDPAPTSEDHASSVSFPPESVDKPIDTSDGLPLPSRWMKPRKSQLDLTDDGLEISTKAMKFASDSIVPLVPQSRNVLSNCRTDKYITSRIGIYYFEIEILFGLNMGSDISIGFMGMEPDEVALVSDLRGHDDRSWGYNGREGKLTHYKFGKLDTQACANFGNGDTVGCGINFVRNKIFITKNGVFLGEAFDLPETVDHLYPVVSMCQWNHVRANFGLIPQRPFVFDIDNYVQSFKNQQIHSVASFDFPSFKFGTRTISDDTDLKPLTNTLIQNYFAELGYRDSLGSFQKDLKMQGEYAESSIEIDPKLIQSLDLKKEVRKMIKSDDIDGVLDLLLSRWPEFDKKVIFRLNCLKLVDLIRKGEIDASIKLAAQLKEQNPGESSQERIRELTSMVAYEHPEECAIFTDYYAPEKFNVTDDAILSINENYCRYPPSCSFDYLLGLSSRSLDEMVKKKQKGAQLTNMDQDYVNL